MKLLVALGLVFVLQQTAADCFRLGCSAPCGQNCVPTAYNFGSCGCGLDHESEMSACKPERCVPMVVRPQELAKPALPLTAALTPVPGPCIAKKAIVKPAILPRPSCRPSPPTVSVVDSCHHNLNSLSNTVTTFGAPYAGHSGPSDCRPIAFGGVYPPVVSCKENEAHCAPADAVSLQLAYKMAQEHCHQSEDKLQFGFRKLPQELPKKKIVEKNIPEEKIFALNGQIVELKPVKVCHKKSLDEEAAEDLLALEEEEEHAAEDHGALRKLSLGEIGYAPAKLPSPTFVDVPIGNVVATAADAVNKALHSSSCCNSPSCKVVAGNVVYKTVPKPQQICSPPIPIPDSCESEEIQIEEEPQDVCTCSCVPLVTKHHHSCHHKSSRRHSVTIEKFCH